jgi:hypothetical protein
LQHLDGVEGGARHPVADEAGDGEGGAVGDGELREELVEGFVSVLSTSDDLGLVGVWDVADAAVERELHPLVDEGAACEQEDRHCEEERERDADADWPVAEPRFQGRRKR